MRSNSLKLGIVALIALAILGGDPLATMSM
jgi:hypothetical protein